jgi:transcriptional regulator with XRE-family HTH domain
MNIADLASAAGVAIGTVTGIEGRKVGWTNATLQRLAMGLNISPASLLEVDPLLNPVFWEAWDRADERQRERITEHAIGVVGPKRD